jgi:hypothetical protein
VHPSSTSRTSGSPTARRDDQQDRHADAEGEGRYIVRPDSASGSPSRTSVNLTGDVVTANRSGGVDQGLRARVESCVESNGMPGIQTSTDANFLPWGVEECVAWHTPMNYVSQRPVGVDAGHLQRGDLRLGEPEGVDLGQQQLQNGTVDVICWSTARPARSRTRSRSCRHQPRLLRHLRRRGRQERQLLGLAARARATLVFVDLQTLQYKTWPMVDARLRHDGRLEGLRVDLLEQRAPASTR